MYFAPISIQLKLVVINLFVLSAMVWVIHPQIIVTLDTLFIFESKHEVDLNA